MTKQSLLRDLLVQLSAAALITSAAFASGPVAPPSDDRDNTMVGLSLNAPVVSGGDVTAPDAPTVLGCPLAGLPNDNSTSVNERAPNLRNRFGRSVYLIKQSELGAAGITPGQYSGIGWTFATAPGLAGSGPLIVYLQNTVDTTNLKSTTWATAIAGMTVVHNATTNIPNVTGSWDILFSGGPFNYTGGGLYVAFDAQYPVGTLSTTTAVLCNSTGLVNGLLGAQGTTAPLTTVASSFRPETRLTPTNATTLSDASSDFVLSYGELPKDLVGPQVVQAVVSNRGANALFNLPVQLNVSGANVFTDNKVISNLPACTGRATVTFSPYAATNPGSETLTVILPPDQVPTNNTKSVQVNVTVPNYSFKHPGSIAAGGVGLNGATGAFVAKFTTTHPTTVNAVTLEFAAASATTYRVALYADSGTGTPGAQLYLDGADRTVVVAGSTTIPLPPISVGPGNFFAGVQQTNTTNASISFDNESPIRSGKFFIAAPLPVTTWTDFSPGNDFKLNIGVIVDACSGGPSVCDDGNSCTIDLCDSGLGCTHATQPDGTICDDGNTCTLNDFCTAGICGGTPGPCVNIQPGIDLFTSPNGLSQEDFGCLPIPGSFFDPGSEPFDGTVLYGGAPISPSSGLGPTDTIVQRLGTVNLVGPGSTGNVPIELVALSLVSAQPITVRYIGGGTEQWNVGVCLSDVVPQPIGSMIITNGQCAGDGGTFSSNLPVCPKLTFTRVTGPPATRVLDPCALGMPPLVMQTNNGHWVDNPDPAFNLNQVMGTLPLDTDCNPGTPAVTLPGTSNFHPGVGVRRDGPGCDGPGTQQKRLTDEDAQLAKHGVLPAQPPPPDIDLDGIGDDADNCKFIPNPNQRDKDDDGVGDACDNCPNFYNPNQFNFDGDSAGDACDCNPSNPAIESCEDKNPCTDDICDQILGCSHLFNANVCDDGNGCTSNDVCIGGNCVGGPPAFCDDGNACTADSCNSACHGVYSVCQSAAITCDDGNPCTNDSCNTITGCVFTPNNNACDDGIACTTGDVCGGGVCSGTPGPAPGEAANVQAPNKTNYTWSAVPGATRYDVVRGSTAALPVGPGGGDETCFDNLPGPTLNDAVVPGAGAGFWYLSRAENQCGNGTYGTQSNGTPRVSATCP